MSNDYFSHFLTGTNNAYKVGVSRQILYEGLTGAITLTGSPPTEAYKIAVTVVSVAGHVGCAGTVTVGTEDIEFSGATRKVTARSWTANRALPSVSVDGLDCQILIECVNIYGVPFQIETLTPIEIVCFPKTILARQEAGGGSMSSVYQIYTTAKLNVGDRLRIPDPFQADSTHDVFVQNRAAGVDIEVDNSEEFRIYICA
jgi:hypothetical protein